MKRILVAILFCLTAAVAQAAPSIPVNNHTGNMVISTHHNNSYDAGYHDGKNHAYNNAIRTVAIVGAVAIAGIIIYEISNPRWTTNENGIVYRF